MQHPPSEEKLISIGLQIDESHLVKHIHAVVQRSLQFVKQDVLELRSQLQNVISDVKEVKRDLFDIHEVKLRKLATTLTDVRSAVTENRAGAKALRKAIEERRAAEESDFEHAALFERLGDVETGGQDPTLDALDLDGERIKALELACAKLREQLRVVVEETTPSMMDSVSQRFEMQQHQTKDLLAFLGVSGAWDAHVPEHLRGVTFTVQGIAESKYMRPFMQDADVASRRLVQLEQAMGKKCDRAELEVLQQGITDVRGACDATKMSLADLRSESSAALQAAQRELRHEITGKVGWPDMDLWKQSVNDALTKTKDSMVKSNKLVAEVRTEGEDIRRQLEELSEKVAEIVVSHAEVRHRSISVSAAHQRPADGDTAPNAGTTSGPSPQVGSVPDELSNNPQANANDFGYLLDGVDSAVKRKIQQATQAAYYAYAEVTPPNNIRVEASTGASQSFTPEAGAPVGAQKRPRSALLMRRR